MQDAQALFAARAGTLVGVIHLPNLARTSVDALVARAAADAHAYAEAGFRALLVENYGDAPFAKDRVAPHVPALLARAAASAQDATGLPVGVNALRNDGRAALAACHAAGGAFVRVNVLTGAVVTDQGIIEGDAAGLAAYRDVLSAAGGPAVRILADVDVKHAAPLVARPLAEIAEETVRRAGAGGLLVTGPATGRSVDLDQLRMVVGLDLGVPVWAASGVDANSVATVLEIADGAIVGTAAKQGGVTSAPVDAQRAQAIVDAC